MSTLYLIKVPGGLAPEGDEASEALEAWHSGEVLRAEIVKVRNPKFHRRAMAFLRLVFENQDKYRTFEDMLVEFKIRSGHYEEHLTADGRLVYVPKSISFGSMDEVDFKKMYSQWVDIALEVFIPKWSHAELENVMNRLVGFL